jgi:hypothetical protein
MITGAIMGVGLLLISPTLGYEVPWLLERMAAR